MAGMTCKHGCGTLITFDDLHLSSTGRKIPLDYKTGEPHQCPNSPYNKQQQQKQQQRGGTTGGGGDYKRVIEMLEAYGPKIDRILALLENRPLTTQEENEDKANQTKGYTVTDMLLEQAKQAQPKETDQEEGMPHYGDDNGEYH